MASANRTCLVFMNNNSKVNTQIKSVLNLDSRLKDFLVRWGNSFLRDLLWSLIVVVRILIACLLLFMAIIYMSSPSKTIVM